jgi:hypothetical protein
VAAIQDSNESRLRAQPHQHHVVAQIVHAHILSMSPHTKALAADQKYVERRLGSARRVGDSAAEDGCQSGTITEGETDLSPADCAVNCPRETLAS